MRIHVRILHVAGIKIRYRGWSFFFLIIPGKKSSLWTNGYKSMSALSFWYGFAFNFICLHISCNFSSSTLNAISPVVPDYRMQNFTFSSFYVHESGEKVREEEETNHSFYARSKLRLQVLPRHLPSEATCCTKIQGENCYFHQVSSWRITCSKNRMQERTNFTEFIGERKWRRDYGF